MTGLETSTPKWSGKIGCQAAVWRYRNCGEGREGGVPGTGEHRRVEERDLSEQNGGGVIRTALWGWEQGWKQGCQAEELLSALPLGHPHCMVLAGFSPCCVCPCGCALCAADFSEVVKIRQIQAGYSKQGWWGWLDFQKLDPFCFLSATQAEMSVSL